MLANQLKVKDGGTLPSSLRNAITVITDMDADATLFVPMADMPSPAPGTTSEWWEVVNAGSLTEEYDLYVKLVRDQKIASFNELAQVDVVKVPFGSSIRLLNVGLGHPVFGAVQPLGGDNSGGGSGGGGVMSASVVYDYVNGDAPFDNALKPGISVVNLSMGLSDPHRPVLELPAIDAAEDAVYEVLAYNPGLMYGFGNPPHVNEFAGSVRVKAADGDLIISGDHNYNTVVMQYSSIRFIADKVNKVWVVSGMPVGGNIVFNQQSFEFDLPSKANPDKYYMNSPFIIKSNMFDEVADIGAWLEANNGEWPPSINVFGRKGDAPRATEVVNSYVAGVTFGSSTVRLVSDSSTKEKVVIKVLSTAKGGGLVLSNPPEGAEFVSISIDQKELFDIINNGIASKAISLPGTDT